VDVSCSSIIRYNAKENVWRYGRIRRSDESLQSHVSGGEMCVAKPTEVFWNYTKEFYFQEALTKRNIL
jgi:hypothetical protein